MSDSGVKIEVHLLQNFAPSNLNRDDTGQPKSATFGGFRRARISSQCSKRSSRQMWRQSGSVSVGERTKLLKAELVPQLKANGRSDEQIGTALDAFLAQFYSKMDDNKTAVLLFVSRDEISEAKALIDKHWETFSAGNKLANNDKKAAESALDKAKMSAPRVVAKGTLLMAQRIVEIARAHNVPVVQNVPLARALYSGVQIDQEIPPALYQTVAEVLAFVFSLKKKSGLTRSG